MGKSIPSYSRGSPPGYSPTVQFLQWASIKRMPPPDWQGLSNMSLAKVLLLAGVGTFGLLALRGAPGPGQRALWRLGGSAILLAAALAVLFPDALTSIANSVGVGRGADLVLYVLAVCFLLTTVTVFRRIRELEERYVRLARRVAINETNGPQESPPTSVGD